MKNRFLIPLTLWILWHSCQNISDPTKNTLKDTLIQTKSIEQTIPKVEYDVSLSYEQQQIVDGAVKGYFSLYPCSMKTIIIASDNVENEKNEKTLAYTKPHCIYLNIEDIIDNNAFKNTIIHELFHTIKPDTLKLTTPYKLKDGYSVIGYHGLSIVVKNDQQQTQFGVFEDAAAEALASLYYNNYQVPNVYYANIGSLILKMIHRWWLTADDLIDYQSNNSFESFCEKIIDKKPTSKDIESLMQIFNDVYSTDQDLTNSAIQKIELIRKK